jgi:hypothetical protein
MFLPPFCKVPRFLGNGVTFTPLSSQRRLDASSD